MDQTKTKDEIINSLKEEIADLHNNITGLLQKIGDHKICSCGALIYFVKHKNGKTAPYTTSGQNHFIDCPKAKNFRK